jgi:integrase
MKGSKKRQSENSWQLSVYKGMKDGKRQYHRETFHGTESQADSRLAELVADLHRGEYVEPSKVDFGGFLLEWVGVREPEIEKGTRHAYRGYIDNHILPDKISKIKLDKLTLTNFNEFRNRLLLKPALQRRKDKKSGEWILSSLIKNGEIVTLAPKTVKNILTMCREALTYACQDNRLKYNPAQYVKNPIIPDYEPETLGAEEAVKFLQAGQGDRFFFMLLLYIYFGKRNSEIRALKAEDLHLDKLLVEIRRSVRGSGYGAEFKKTKTAVSKKPLELQPWMVPFFEREMLERKKERLAYGEGYRDLGLVFASYNGNVVKERTLMEHFRAILKKAGLPEGTRIHDLRHSCAEILADEEVDLKHIQNRLAHATIGTTADRYIHRMRGGQKPINKKMDKALKVDRIKRPG